MCEQDAHTKSLEWVLAMVYESCDRHCDEVGYDNMTSPSKFIFNLVAPYYKFDINHVIRDRYK